MSTATVETLTAEVRVLMVGNRQMTMSVAKQLDWCDLEELQPFGRVHINRDQVDTLVIGRHQSSGALRIARCYPSRDRWTPMVDPEDLSGKVTVCNSVLTGPDYFRFQFGTGNVSILINKKATEKCEIEDHGPRPTQGECGYWYPNDQQENIVAVIERCNARFSLHKQARELPLIVLAGLK